MYLLRKMHIISWTDRKTNSETNEHRKLLREIRLTQSKLFLRIMRVKIENFATTGKFDEDMTGGRPRCNYLDNLWSWYIRVGSIDLIRDSGDCEMANQDSLPLPARGTWWWCMWALYSMCVCVCQYLLTVVKQQLARDGAKIKQKELHFCKVTNALYARLVNSRVVDFIRSLPKF